MKLIDLECITMVEPLTEGDVEVGTIAQVRGVVARSSRYIVDREDEIAEKLISKLQGQIDELVEFRRNHKVKVIERAINQANWMKKQLEEAAMQDVYRTDEEWRKIIRSIAELKGYEGKP